MGIMEVVGFAGRNAKFSAFCLRVGGNGFESFVDSIVKEGTSMISVRYFAEDIPRFPSVHSRLKSCQAKPLFMESRIKVITRDKCDNERTADGLSPGFHISTKLLPEDVDDIAQSSRLEQEDWS